MHGSFPEDFLQIFERRFKASSHDILTFFTSILECFSKGPYGFLKGHVAL
jgi:hypothetical protein